MSLQELPDDLLLFRNGKLKVVFTPYTMRTIADTITDMGYMFGYLPASTSYFENGVAIVQKLESEVHDFNVFIRTQNDDSIYIHIDIDGAQNTDIITESKYIQLDKDVLRPISEILSWVSWIDG
jgi:hypothetical protein